MTEVKFELLLAAMCEQSKELHAIHDALKRLRGISYAVYIILCILAGLAGLALLDVPFWGGSRQVRPAALFVWHSVRAASFRSPERLPLPRFLEAHSLIQRENAPKARPFLQIEAAGNAPVNRDRSTARDCRFALSA
jgi:hypothetical protein